jgi:glycosyltransferase 2 family protein
MKDWRNIILNIFKIIFTIGIIFYLFNTGQINPEEIGKYKGSPKIFYINLFLIFLLPFLGALRWQGLLTALSVRLNYMQSLQLTWVGFFFSSFLPGAVTGDILKGFYLEKKIGRDSRRETVVSLLTDRICGVFGLILLGGTAAVFSFFLDFKFNDLAAGFGLLLILGVAAILVFLCVIFFPWKKEDPVEKILNYFPIAKIFLRVYHGFRAFKNHPRYLFLALLYSIINHSIIAVVIINAVWLFDNNIPAFLQLKVLPFALTTTVLPVAPAGIGIGHAAFQSLYSLVGFSQGADAFNLFLALQLPISLMGSIFYLFLRKGKEFTDSSAKTHLADE